MPAKKPDKPKVEIHCAKMGRKTKAMPSGKGYYCNACGRILTPDFVHVPLFSGRELSK